MERLIDGASWPCVNFTAPPLDTPLGQANPPQVDISESGQARYQDLFGRLNTAAQEGADARLTEGVRRLLAIIADHSPYLSRLIDRDPAFLLASLDRAPQAQCADIIADVRALRADDAMTSLMKALRQAKSRFALLVALADIGRLWPLETVTRMLSDFADACLDRAGAHAMAAAFQKGELEGPEDLDAAFRQSGYVVLALGKQGGRELNYSSDIDPIILYDQEKVRYKGDRSPGDLFVRVTQKMVKILQDRTEDGYVFRVDLRLRPDPGATPVAISMGAAETYYQSIGQPWERSAMIKARVAAGDPDAGAEYLERMRPFIWRRHLDFAAIQDIHAMKLRIHEHHGFTELKLAGHDCKIGVGGIREIEFFAQTHQMIAGGRRPELRNRATLDTLKTLADEGDIDRADYRDLRQAYYLLRTVEHRLQMIDDQQTQKLPAEPAALQALGRFLGFADYAAFDAAYERTIKTIHRIYEDLLPEANTGPQQEAQTTLVSLADYGFKDQTSTQEILNRWQAGRYRALATKRAQDLLRAFLPDLLGAFGSAEDPEQALARFDSFLNNLPSGVQLFSLFRANPSLFNLLAKIMSVAPALADRLAKRPVLLDSVLSEDFYDDLPPLPDLREELRIRLADAQDYQDILDHARIWLNDRRFQVGVLLLEGVISPPQAGEHMADLADVTLELLLPHIIAAFAESGPGHMPDGHFAVIAMGSYGTRKLTYSSDLDLIFLYKADADAAGSDGPKSLFPSQYYSRLSQRIISAISAMTSEGRLFEIDMRLRPSGRSGIIAVSLDAFNTYHADSAWTWEHLALMKARPLASGDDFCREVDQAIQDIICRPRSWEKIAADVRDMRHRFDVEFGAARKWSLRNARGGLADIDFITEALSLRRAAENRQFADSTFAQRLEMLEACQALAPAQVEAIRQAERLLFDCRSVGRLLVGAAEKLESTTPAVTRSLAQALGYEDLAAVENAVARAKEKVKTIFTQVFGPINEDQ